MGREQPETGRLTDTATGKWDFWIDRGGTFTDVVARDPDGRSGSPSCSPRTAQAYADAAIAGIRRLIGVADGAADPAGRDRRGEDGHHGRHQCAARAQGRPDAAAHHPRLPRRAQDRLPGAAGHLRQEDRQAGDALRARRRGRRARARRRHGRGRARPRRGARATCEAAWDAGIRSVAIVFMHAWRYPEHEQQVARARPRHGLPAGLGQPRGLAADQAGRPRRHHRGRCLSLADPPALCRPGGAGARRQPDPAARLVLRGRFAATSDEPEDRRCPPA